MEAANWARRKADEENTSVSKMVGRMLEAQMKQADSCRTRRGTSPCETQTLVRTLDVEDAGPS